MIKHIKISYFIIPLDFISERKNISHSEAVAEAVTTPT